MKLENVRSRLAAVIDAQERRPFAFGSDDCLLRVAEAVEAITGKDHAAPFRGTYDTLEGGYAALKSAGYATPLSLLGKLFKPVAIAAAEDGDIAAKKHGQHWTFGVIVGAHFYVTTEVGTGILPRSSAEKAYRVK